MGSQKITMRFSDACKVARLQLLVLESDMIV